jgi:predicted GNAT family N-acyltransferase
MIAMMSAAARVMEYMPTICQEITDTEGLEACFALRREVFVGEQSIPETLEMDGQDAQARHFAVMEDGKIIATCRVRRMGIAAKIERMAVQKGHRRQGLGRELMKYVLQRLTAPGDIKLLKLSSQADAVPFYEQLSFKKRGPEYIDAGIPHYDMTREL